MENLDDERLKRAREIEAQKQAKKIENISHTENSYSNFYYKETGNADFGIPSQEDANMSKKIIEEYEKGKNKKFRAQRKEIIEKTITKYEKDTQVKDVSFEHMVNGDASWALAKLRDLLNMPDTPEYTQYMACYLEKLKSKPEYYNEIFSTMLNRFASIKKKVISGQYLERFERQQLVNSLKLFSIIVEKGYPVNYNLFDKIEMPYHHNYGNYYDSERIPYDIVIQQIIEVINQKQGTIGNEVTNPINIISSVGNNKIKATELGKLALKAHYTKHKLSDDVMNFPNTMNLSNIENFKKERDEQQKQDQIMRNGQLSIVNVVNKNEDHKLK